MKDDNDPEPALYDQTVRDLLGELEGRRIIGLSQHDRLEYLEGAPAFLALHLDDGSLLVIFQRTGDVSLERPDGRTTTIGLPGPDDDEEADVEA